MGVRHIRRSTLSRKPTSMPDSHSTEHTQRHLGGAALYPQSHVDFCMSFLYIATCVFVVQASFVSRLPKFSTFSMHKQITDSMDSDVLQPTGFQYRIIFADAGCITSRLENSLIKGSSCSRSLYRCSRVGTHAAQTTGYLGDMFNIASGCIPDQAAPALAACTVAGVSGHMPGELPKSTSDDSHLADDSKRTFLI